MPWMVAIVKKNANDTGHCSASLVTPKFIISAAHCFEDDRKESFEVVLGTDFLKIHFNNFQKYQKRLEIAKLHIHPDYKRGTYNDFAIIELSTQVTYGVGIYPICLPQTETKTVQSGQLVTVVGYGKTRYVMVYSKLNSGMKIFIFLLV